MGETNEANMAMVEVKPAMTPQAAGEGSRQRKLHLVLDDALLGALGNRLPQAYQATALSQLNPEALLDALAHGDSLVWVGRGAALPKALSVGSFSPGAEALAVGAAEGSPLLLGEWPVRQAHVESAYIAPPKEMPAHNHDEEVRGDFLPILAARDRFGRVVGYPGVLMHYNAPSLVGRRFAGSQCYFFLFEQPAEAMQPTEWGGLLEKIAKRFESGLRIQRVETDYSAYRSGERVHVRARLANDRTRATAAEVRFSLKGPGDKDFSPLHSLRRCPDGGGESDALCDFPITGVPGLWTLRVDACQDESVAEELAIEGQPQPLDRREIGVVLLASGELKTPKLLTVKGLSIRLEGQDGFWAGTHYYPSSSWWEWVWRDFRPLKAAQDFAAIRRAGYRIVRVWVDPVLDEQSMRAMDAAVWLAAQEGIVLDVCIFTQWVRRIGFERASGERVAFDFRRPNEFNVFSISLRNLDLQREYAQLLARRWRKAGNVLYNLSNETFLKDPDASQMDEEAVKWEGIPRENGRLRDSLLFRRWGAEITAAMRAAGARQPIMPGYMFTVADGGDNYLGNRDAEIEAWHCYYGPEMNGLTLHYVDPACSNRPVILEEFGMLGWNRPEHYDACAHYALASGAAAAMSYEWGVSWLAPEMCFYPLPLREILDTPSDPRFFQPIIEMAKTMPRRGVGLCLTPSGFGYGSVYHGTPFPAEAAVALGRLGLMGQGLGRAFKAEQVYVLIPTARYDQIESVYPVLRALWREKIPFGVWQEDCLTELPRSARVVLCPIELSSESASLMDALRRRGVEVHAGQDEGWKTSAKIKRLNLTGGEDCDLHVRRTGEGTLYTLISENHAPELTLTTERQQQVTLGLTQYGLVHERQGGIGLVEAAGKVTINGTGFCEIERGRAILSALEGQPLPSAQRLRLMATEPTHIRFAREIASVTVLEEGQEKPLTTFAPPSADRFALNVDRELLRYVLQVEFK